METNSNKNTATLTHLSTLTQYFIPFGNYIFPIVIWSTQRDKSEYVNAQGKQTINFQLSLFVYTLILALIAIPIFCVTFLRSMSFDTFFDGGDFMIQNLNLQHVSGMVTLLIMAVLVFVAMKVAEFFLIIYAAVKTSNGENFKYPLTIPFIR